MALIKCPECGKEISSDCKMCPSCGKQLKKPVAPVILLVLSVLISLWAASIFLIPSTNYLQSHNEQFFQENYYMFFLIIGTALLSGVLLLVNTRVDSKPLNAVGIALSVVSLALFAIYTGMENSLTIFFFIFITPPILGLVAGFKLRK